MRGWLGHSRARGERAACGSGRFGRVPARRDVEELARLELDDDPSHVCAAWVCRLVGSIQVDTGAPVVLVMHWERVEASPRLGREEDEALAADELDV